MRPVVASQTGARSVSVTPGQSVSDLIQGVYVPKSQSLLDELLQGRTYTPKDANGTVRVGSPFGLPAPVAGTSATAVRSIPWAAVARGAARAVPIAGTAIAVKDLYDEIRCREGFGGGPECDLGVPEITESGYLWATRTGPNGSDEATGYHITKEAACARSLELSNEWAAQAGLPGQPTAWSIINAGATCRVVRGGSVWYDGSFRRSSLQTITRCPTIPGHISIKGVDGKCSSGEYEDIEYTDLEKRIEDYGTKTRAPGLVQAGELAGIPFEHDVPEVEAPGVIQGGRETITRPDGTTITKDREFVTSPRPGGLDWEERITEREWPAGTVPTAPGVPPGGSTPPGTVIQNPGGAAPGDAPDLECGIPGYPPCKIDESGTPTSDGLPDATAAVAATTAGILGCISDPSSCFPVMPSLSWDFALPSACGEIPLPAFAPYVSSIDVCAYQPMFHELMSVVWQLGGLFGAIAMFWRKTFAS